MRNKEREYRDPCGGCDFQDGHRPPSRPRGDDTQHPCQRHQPIRPSPYDPAHTTRWSPHPRAACARYVRASRVSRLQGSSCRTRRWSAHGFQPPPVRHPTPSTGRAVRCPHPAKDSRHAKSRAAARAPSLPPASARVARDGAHPLPPAGLRPARNPSRTPSTATTRAARPLQSGRVDQSRPAGVCRRALPASCA